MCVSTAVETSHERMGPAAPTHALPRRAGLRVGVPPPPSPSVLIGHASSHPRTNRTRLSEANRRWRAGERVRNLQEGCLLQQDTRRSGPRRVQRDETCPISTEGGTRRVHFVREGGGGVGRDQRLVGRRGGELGVGRREAANEDHLLPQRRHLQGGPAGSCTPRRPGFTCSIPHGVSIS
jgi:hypothetical protein